MIHALITARQAGRHHRDEPPRHRQPLAEGHQRYSASTDALDDLRAVHKRIAEGAASTTPGSGTANDNTAAAQARLQPRRRHDVAVRRRPQMQRYPVDVLVVDEAGQLSLADTLAASPRRATSSCSATRCSCRRWLRRRTRRDSGDSALEHVLGDGRHDAPPTAACSSRRPGACIPTSATFISDEIYEGRLTQPPELRTADPPSPAPGCAGFAPTTHGNSTESPEEADLVAERITATDRHRLGPTARASATPLTARRLHGRRAVQRPGADHPRPARPRSATTRRAGRNGRQVPGPRGRGCVLHHDDVSGRGHRPRQRTSCSRATGSTSPSAAPDASPTWSAPRTC